MATELQKDIMKAVHKVNKMRIDSGQSQYMGRGAEDSSVEEVEPAPVVISDVRENIYDQEDANAYKAATDIMDEIKNRYENVNLGVTENTKLIKRLNKIKDSLGGASVGGMKDLKEQFKFLKQTNPKLYYKLKAETDKNKPKKKKSTKAKGGKKEPSVKQKQWQSFVSELAKKEKYKDMKRSDLLKIASAKYKKQKDN